jgi:LmbE family N-acetylglucosaminyl deacetylase
MFKLNRLLKKQFKDYFGTFIRPKNLITIPQLIEKPSGESIVVLSPHFDDDIIGCGGTLHKHVLASKKVSVIYLTDGREGDPSMSDKNTVEKLRKNEAKNATKTIGITNIIFLDQPETRLRTTNTLLKQLRNILIELKPDLLYIPSFLENNIDHFEANRILLNLSKKSAFDMTVAAYEVWTPLFPNFIVDITSVMPVKEKALMQYETQLRQVDYAGTTLALNRYRSVFNMKGTGYAEAFFITSWKDYINLMKKFGI